MHRFYDGQREVEIATALDELTPDQYQYLITLSGLYASVTEVTEDEFRVRWMSYLSGHGTIDFTLFSRERQEIYREAMKMTDGFFIRSNDGRLIGNFDTERNLLPETDGENGELKGPGDWLEGITFGEFTTCVEALSQAAKCESQDEGALEAYGIIARTLYKIPVGEKIPEILYFHAPTLFRNILSRIESAPIEINGEAIDFRIIFKSVGGEKKADDKTGWTGITFEVASSGIFGDVKGVESSDLWMVLLYLYRCKFEYMHRKKK